MNDRRHNRPISTAAQHPTLRLARRATPIPHAAGRDGGSSAVWRLPKDGSSESLVASPDLNAPLVASALGQVYVATRSQGERGPIVRFPESQ